MTGKPQNRMYAMGSEKKRAAPFGTARIARRLSEHPRIAAVFEWLASHFPVRGSKASLCEKPYRAATTCSAAISNRSGFNIAIHSNSNKGRAFLPGMNAGVSSAIF